jgi:hypothetical protein
MMQLATIMRLAGERWRALIERASANSIQPEPANDLGEAPIHKAIIKIEAATQGFDEIADLLAEALEIARCALLTDDPHARGLIAERFDQLRCDIAERFEGVDSLNLLGGRSPFSAKDLQVELHAAKSQFSEDGAVSRAITELEIVHDRLCKKADQYREHAVVLANQMEKSTSGY